MSLKAAPSIEKLLAPLNRELVKTASRAYGAPLRFKSRNTPHLTKYDKKAGNTGVILHNDASVFTINCLLSEPDADFRGGGTYFEDLDKTIHLDQGEALLHPGAKLHSGKNISAGVRVILVGFLEEVPPTNRLRTRLEGGPDGESEPLLAEGGY